MSTVSYPRRLSDLTVADPDRLAVVCGPDSLTRAQLDEAGTRLAHRLLAHGVVVGDVVTVALPNCVEWFVAYVACWKAGAIPQAVSEQLPRAELEAIVALAAPRAVIGRGSAGVAGNPHVAVDHRARLDGSPVPELPDVVSPAWKIATSGGSTGRPKLIVSGDPALFDPGVPRMWGRGFRDGGVVVVPGPLHHNGPVLWACEALIAGSLVVALERFDPERTLAAVEEFGADVLYSVPTMMKRIIDLDDEARLRYDLSSLESVWHMAEPCPAWLKRRWIDWLGPERIVEIYSAAEQQAVTLITGSEWLERPGSVGRVVVGQMRVGNERGEPLDTGERGEVWLRGDQARSAPMYRYVGAEARSSEDGWESLGDVGWFDGEGYLYMADRLQDMVLSGGVNVYPAEVEAAILEHPAVRSAAVIGLPDDDRGNVVHAVVEADPREIPPEELATFLRERLIAYKVPRSVEYVDHPLRSDAGKVRRGELRSERLNGGGGKAVAMPWPGRMSSPSHG
ncbi:AMP-binding protein [Pseudonocardia sp.]|uniref:AMP-binding protein n=1 Tax=Pseudonocardia sp. TaxID=60912 RepID=UPI00263019A2|nr:AMP-binding protein [Pseudonocardia sp.]